ncbi:hypothetical protein BGC07_03020 [Piscirickettsia litoralis]|uniref:Uncharacterized protein n=2 Tax=Piscirickettsia litoralis TaxID=1891921 RepID=A0ABX2ZZR9_9GAMM|nr:hypothetical protein BGC07_03020 [Piscirickettsia litoralis]
MCATANAMLLAPTDSKKLKEQLGAYIVAFISAAALLVAPTLSAAQGLEKALPSLSSGACLGILSAFNSLSASIFTQGLVDFKGQQFSSCSSQGLKCSDIIANVLAYTMAAVTALSFSALNCLISDEKEFQIPAMIVAGAITTAIWGAGLKSLFQEIKKFCATDPGNTPRPPQYSTVIQDAIEESARTERDRSVSQSGAMAPGV